MKFYNPTVGRRHRMFTSAQQVADYERGFREPEGIEPSATGRPEQLGALDHKLVGWPFQTYHGRPLPPVIQPERVPPEALF